MKMTRKTWLRQAAAMTLAACAATAMAQTKELRVGLIPAEDAQAMLRMIADGRTPDGAAHRMSDLRDVAALALERINLSTLDAIAADIEALR